MSGLVEASADARSKTIGANFRCRVWVNFDGTGTIAIRDSGNVSSLTDQGTGSYTVHFGSDMSDNDYACFISTVNRHYNSGVGYTIGYYSNDDVNAGNYNYNSVRLEVKRSDTNTMQDLNTISVAIFR